MSEMVERVAAAVIEAAGDLRPIFDDRGEPVGIQGEFDPYAIARAAIKAMRDPDMEMVRAVCIEDCRGKKDLSWSDGYRIMLDEASR